MFIVVLMHASLPSVGFDYSKALSFQTIKKSLLSWHNHLRLKQTHKCVLALNLC